MPESTSTDTRRSLVAFVTLRPGVVLSAEELKAYAAQNLPRHLVPNRIEIIEAVPTLPNGKLDRRTLSERAAITRTSTEANNESDVVHGDAARTTTEVKLIPIWASVLSAEYVERGDDFFELGGHSLLATRLVATTNRELGCNLSIADLFDQPILSDFARLIDELA